MDAVKIAINYFSQENTAATFNDFEKLIIRPLSKCNPACKYQSIFISS